MKLMDLYWFGGTFLIIYMVYLFYYVIPKNKKYDENKVPTELVYLIKKYRLDMKKINFKKIMNQIGIASAFDIAFTATFIFMFVKNIYLSVILGGAMIIPLIIITFNVIGNIYKKKGLVINGNKKN